MTQLKIARVILHSDRFKMDRAALKAEGFWKHLKTSYAPRLPQYQQRLISIIKDCAEESPDVTIFPACTAIWRYHAQLEQYRAEMSKLSCVIFGALRVGQARYIEHSEVWAHGKRVMKFNARWPIAVKLAGLPAVIAQSSTIKAVYQAPFLTLPAEKAPANPPYKLAFDLGHGQYQGRYRRVFKKLKSLGTYIPQLAGRRFRNYLAAPACSVLRV